MAVLHSWVMPVRMTSSRSHLWSPQKHAFSSGKWLLSQSILFEQWMGNAGVHYFTAFSREAEAKERSLLFPLRLGQNGPLVCQTVLACNCSTESYNGDKPQKLTNVQRCKTLTPLRLLRIPLPISRVEQRHEPLKNKQKSLYKYTFFFSLYGKKGLSFKDDYFSFLTCVCLFLKPSKKNHHSQVKILKENFLSTNSSFMNSKILL